MNSSKYDEILEKISDSISGIMWILVSVVLAVLIALAIYSMHKADEGVEEACDTYNATMIQEDMPMCP